MADRSSSSQSTVKEAVYGVKANVKTLQQLSSSGQAAQEKRKENHKERAMGFLDAAVKDHVQDGKKNESGKK